MNFLEFCKKELESAGAFDKKRDSYGGLTGKAVMELCEVFAKQDHSGMSAAIVSSMFNRLVKYLPLTPLTGEDWEWQPIGDGLYQNIRCPSVFKEKGKTYQDDYYIFEDEKGRRYTSIKSRKYIEKFPYWPDHEIVKVNNNK